MPVKGSVNTAAISRSKELVEQPFRRLISEGQLLSHAHNGFWACMDTFKELQLKKSVKVQA
jgi:NDP-sugar pyrophosphorylase family protein